MPFFSPASAPPKKVSLRVIPGCGDCGLYRSCQSPKMKPHGEGRKRIAVVGEAPGFEEDKIGRPFVGKAGQRLRLAMRRAGMDLDRDCLVTNALICRPKNNRIENPKSVEYCRPNLTRVLEEFDPEVVIVLGYSAIESVVGPLWRKDLGGVKRWAGWHIPAHKPNNWICPTYHPSFVIREEEKNPAVGIWFDRHIAAACEIEGKPWGEKGPPDFASRVLCEIDTDRAADAIQAICGAGEAVSFDYETNCLKPDGPNSRIVCASVSNGKTTIAFPWHGKAIEAMKDLLTSDLPKFGWNSKFEQRWTKKHLGVWVKRFDWDGMLAAHTLDNRPAITGLKFQSFVRLGQEDYNSHVEPFLRGTSPGGNSTNRIKEVPLSSLLLYCGLDSYLEHAIGKQQQVELGYKVPKRPKGAVS